MALLLRFRLYFVLFLFFFYSFFYNDILFFFNPELIVNVTLFVIVIYSIFYYYGLNQKNLIYQKNEVRKKNVVFYECLIANWKRLQLRNKYIKRIYLAFFLLEIFRAFENEIFFQKSFLEKDIKKFITFRVYVHMKFIEKDLSSWISLNKLFKGLLLNFWFINEHEQWLYSRTA